MRFHFLGTGTSSGIPAIGCDCDVCTSDDPRDTRLRTAAAITFDDPNGAPRTILLDAGPDLRLQALGAGLTRCDAVLFTHNHVDHTFGVDELRRFNVVMQAPIDVYAETHTMDHLRRVYKHIFERDANVNDSFVATLIPHTLDPDRPLDLFGLRFTPIRLLHGKLPIVGYRIEPIDQTVGETEPWWPLAYCTDVSGIPTDSWALLDGVQTLVVDALRHRSHPTHFTVGQAISVAQRVGAPSTWCIHMAHELSHAATDAELPPGIKLAYDGLTLG